METEKQQSTKDSFDWKVVKSAEPVIEQGVGFYLAELENPNGNKQHRLVKQPMNIDGSPRGQSKQIWIPKSNVTNLLNHWMKFVSE